VPGPAVCVHSRLCNTPRNPHGGNQFGEVVHVAGFAGVVYHRILCSISHLYPTPQRIGFGASSCGGGYRMLEGVLASIHAGSWMRISEMTPSTRLGE
jgi:hypothetical protein